MQRMVCWYSCGVASTVAAKLALMKYGKTHEVIVVRCIVREEHPDNDRFAADCEKWLGVPILNLISKEFDGSIYKVITKRRYVGGVGGAPCSQMLKKQVRLDFQKPNDVHVFGYTRSEQKRYDAFLDANNDIDCIVPLIDRDLSHNDCLAVIQNTGIELPAMYKLGYQHNNCIGCVKSTGPGYWNKIKKEFPDRFWMMAGMSRALGVRMTRSSHKVRIFLDELTPDMGDYENEPEPVCGMFCEMIEKEILAADKVT